MESPYRFYTLLIKKKVYLFIPVTLLVVVRFIAKYSQNSFQDWAWLITAMAYWIGILSIVKLCYGEIKTPIVAWFRKTDSADSMAIGLKALLPLVILAPLSVLLLEVGVFVSSSLIFIWLLFAIVNPFFEELFWRGVMLNSHSINIKFKVIVSSSIYVMFYVAIWGVFSEYWFSLYAMVSLFITSLILALMTVKTKSLLGSYLLHVVFDVLNLTALILMNNYTPKW